MPDLPAEPAADDMPASRLLAECLDGYEEGGAEGLSSVLRRHPERAQLLLRRVLLLAELGLLPEPPAS
ncbi:MAG TPA: hypothetical protein VFY71_14910 [Planctomycetota bacterium]|nr:hypothetical protein [Planctomycetota bacterium]